MVTALLQRDAQPVVSQQHWSGEIPCHILAHLLQQLSGFRPVVGKHQRADLRLGRDASHRVGAGQRVVGETLQSRANPKSSSSSRQQETRRQLVPAFAGMARRTADLVATGVAGP